LITLRTDKQVDTSQSSGDAGEGRETLVIDQKPQRCIRLETTVNGRTYVVYRCRPHNTKGRTFVGLRPKEIEGARPALFDFDREAAAPLGPAVETQRLVRRMLRVLQFNNVSFTAP
jgi:hypothetical protein